VSERRVPAVLALGAASLVSALFAPVRGAYEFVNVRGPGVYVALAGGALAILAGLLGRRVPVIVAAVLFLGAAVLQLVQWGHPTNWLQGDGSTVSLWLGLGLGLLVLALSPEPDRVEGS
jgi:hypothetical protein